MSSSSRSWGDDPEVHHVLAPDLAFDPEAVFFIDYLADEDGWAHTMQRPSRRQRRLHPPPPGAAPHRHALDLPHPRPGRHRPGRGRHLRTGRLHCGEGQGQHQGHRRPAIPSAQTSALARCHRTRLTPSRQRSARSSADAGDNGQATFPRTAGILPALRARDHLRPKTRHGAGPVHATAKLGTPDLHHVIEPGPRGGAVRRRSP